VTAFCCGDIEIELENWMNARRNTLLVSVALCAIVVAGCGKKDDAIAKAEKKDAEKPGVVAIKDTVKEAYIYGFPMLMNYGVMRAYFVDRDSGQYKAPFNTIYNEARVFTYKDTAIVTPNSDTPYSFVGLDLRAEPIVLCVPAVEKKRYYDVQLVDMYTFNYGYIGSRATGNDAGCYVIAGPDWKGDTPPNIKRCFARRRSSASWVFGHNSLVRVTCRTS
jgi:hypothetical protein